MRTLRRALPNLVLAFAWLLGGASLAIATGTHDSGDEIDPSADSPGEFRVQPELSLAPVSRERADELVPNSTGFQLTEAEREIVRGTNLIRKRAGLPPLAVDPRLMEQARAKARSMARAGTMSHSLEPRTQPGQGENIAVGYRDAEAAVRGWEQSPGHYRNIVHSTIRSIGVSGGMPGTDGKPYYVQVFSI